LSSQRVQKQHAGESGNQARLAGGAHTRDQHLPVEYRQSKSALPRLVPGRFFTDNVHPSFAPDYLAVGMTGLRGF